MLRKIKLYGKLAKFIGHRVLEADVATAAEAVRFLLANWPEVERHMADQHYRVSIGTYDIDLEELHHPAGAAPISFVPVVAGAGATGRKIIAGIALISTCIFCSDHRGSLDTNFCASSICYWRLCQVCSGVGRTWNWRRCWRHITTSNATPTQDQPRRRRPPQEPLALAGFRTPPAWCSSPLSMARRWSAAL
jgi:hypothetical protein